MVRANSEQTSSLSERDIAILGFESRWSRHGGAKEEAIKRHFGLSAARYYQVLNVVIDSPAAVRHDPMLVRRLQRAREARLAARTSRAFSGTVGDVIDSPPSQ